MATDDKKNSIEQLKEDILNQLKVDANTFIESSDALSQYANQVNTFFTQGRQRIAELQTALADATPSIARMGGSIGDVADIIGKVATESRRNVIANTEDVEKLFAANKVLELGADTLTKAFLDVGAGIETIGDTLEESINYIQSIGGNAKTVMRDVTNNMDQMNRYQFEGGVQGLTKMAAQASMLRFDMNQTFQLADKVLSPEGAIETAAAFQRLGVAAGTLADPFALMNASINDPGALQDSLVDVAKQFTYFDEKTKTFKINPQGVLTLKELQTQTGVSAAEMSKLGLAAAEADKRISAVGSAGLNIDEEDKQYLANIATMGKGGEYEVKIRNEEGKEETRKLAEITQTEFEKLIDEQKNRPKDMEEIARSQMSTSEVIKGDVSAIRAKIVGGVVSAGQIVEGKERIRSGITNVSGEFSKMGDTASVRTPVETGLSDINKLIDDLKVGNDYEEDIAKYLENSGKLLGKIEEDFKKSLEETGEKISANFEPGSYEKKLTDMLRGKIDENSVSQQAAGNQPVSSLLEGRQNQMREVEAASSTQASSQKTIVEIVGGMKIEMTFTGDAAGFTQTQKEQMAKAFTEKFNSTDYKQYVANISTKQNPTKSDSQFNYPSSK
jgi:hypothetical protein